MKIFGLLPILNSLILMVAGLLIYKKNKNAKDSIYRVLGISFILFGIISAILVVLYYLFD